MRWLLLLSLLAAPAWATPDRWQREWPETDFSQTTLSDWSEVLSGGPPKDGIPAITTPKMIPVREARLPAQAPLIALEGPDQVARAYPLRYLTWHEIVNDEVAGRPIAVTFCPLCNSGRIFDRRIEGRTLTFGVSGKLRNSDMIMYDRETQSWWQQAVGRGIVGEMSGRALTPIPSRFMGWAQFQTLHPQGLVMAEPAFARDYGRNPYAGYDSAPRPFLYDGEMPPEGIAPLERVVRVGNRAWPLRRLAQARRIEEAGVILTWAAGQASALDQARIAESRDVGSVTVTDGAGLSLDHDVLFAFAFQAFWPEGIWMMAAR